MNLEFSKAHCVMFCQISRQLWAINIFCHGIRCLKYVDTLHHLGAFDMVFFTILALRPNE